MQIIIMKTVLMRIIPNADHHNEDRSNEDHPKCNDHHNEDRSNEDHPKCRSS